MPKIFASKNSDIEQRELEHMRISREVAGECMVLLENDGALPLTEKKAALFGNGARKTVKGGTGSGDVNTRSNVNIEQGFLNAGFEITTTDWLDRQDARVEKAKADYMAWLRQEAEKKGVPEFSVSFDHPYQEPEPEAIVDADMTDASAVAVYVIARNSGEGADRFNAPGDYLLDQKELENIQLVASHYSKTIVILNIGGVMDLSALKKVEGVNAVLLMTQLGNIGGDALLDVLTGAVNPSGKTTDTWAKNYMDYPSSAKFSHNESVHDENYEDGIYVGYRYFDTFGIAPLYPFGYGLSYTTFELTTEQVSVEGENVKIAVNVKNTGANYAGKEVVQIYYSAPAGIIDKPYQELIAYKKTSLLAPGASQRLEVTFDIKDMASYCETCASWVLEPGEYVILVGNSSASTKAAAVLTLDTLVKTQTGKNLFAPDTELTEIKPAQRPTVAVPSGVERIAIDASSIQTETICYQGERAEYTTGRTEKITMADILSGSAAVEELVAQLTIEEMAELCVGTLRAGEGSIVGNASNTVPGAAGDTSSVCYETRGIKNLILADGPAGLRLQPHFKTTKDGTLLPGGEILGESVNPFADDIDEANVDNYYQYCTAIPIGWALAQSWNEELMMRAGDMIGSEMEQFHVDLWLAPALNIHRNPLCGRNFEYYSEDPLVSGRTAMAMTMGVQKHPGKGTTIKHFAANNQEDNRYFVNAHVSERALREIYLKGFEIAVRKSQPLSIMTSYNLLNGIHTANSHDLIQAVARDEWGFAGMVMTDWFTSQDIPALTGKFNPIYPISASTGCIFAGNDVQMPGCSKNVDDIVEAVRTGSEIDGYRITKADLQYCAANIIRVVAKCTASET